jgi:hypothetical protein
MLITLFAKSEAIAQEATGENTAIYRLETHLELGPMISYFYRGRTLPQGASNFTAGYQAMFRIMWHPDHLLAVGMLTGFQELVSEKYNVTNATSTGNVSASLHAVPLMVDVSMEGPLFEFGVGLGGYIITTILDDNTVSRASRLELGTIAHATYHWHVSEHFLIGANAMLSEMSYRGILSFGLGLDFKYDLLNY